MEKVFVEQIARPLSKEEGLEKGFLYNDDVWKLKHYVLDFPAILKVEKEWLAEQKKENGASDEIVYMEKKIYLGDYLKDLGDCCIFDKVATGCGGTTLALQDERNCIIAMPTRNTVQSKGVLRNPLTHAIEGVDDRILCIWGGHYDKVSDLGQYLQDCDNRNRPYKIVATYDQIYNLIGRLVHSFGKSFNNVGNPWFLYIDEMHEIYNAYQDSKPSGRRLDYNTALNQEENSRRNRIRRMLEQIKYFDHVIFITATLIPDKYFFKEIADYPNTGYKADGTPRQPFKVYHVNFPEGSIAKITPRLRPTAPKDMTKAVASYLQKYIDGEIESNAHVFFNSVRGILDIVKKIDIINNASKIRIVCGDDEGKNEERILAVLDKELAKLYPSKRERKMDDIYKNHPGLALLYNRPVSSINDNPKRINFYTSTAFCGADIFDDNSQVVVVSWGDRQNTMYDISTQFKQIIGRIRNASEPPIYYFSENRYLHTTATGERQETEFEETDKNRESSKEKVKKMAEVGGEDFFNGYDPNRLDNLWLRKVVTGYDSAGKAVFGLVDDEILEAKDRINEKTMKDLFSVVTLSEAMKERKMEATVERVAVQRNYQDSFLNRITSRGEDKVRTTFKEIFLEYCQIAEEENKTQDEKDFVFKRAGRKYPYIGDIYLYIPHDDIEKKFNYNYHRYLKDEVWNYKEAALRLSIIDCLKDSLLPFMKPENVERGLGKEKIESIKKVISNRFNLPKFDLSKWVEMKRKTFRESQRTDGSWVWGERWVLVRIIE